MLKRLTIFGVGLIGGSLGLALKQRGYCQTIVGCGRDESHLRRAVQRGAIDRYTLDPAEAVRDTDMILLAVPVGAVETVARQFAPHLPPQAIITDAGSSKRSVVDAIQNAFGTLPENFVPAHPIAGREKSGIEAAVGDLYIDHKVILCPHDTTAPSAIDQVTRMWEAAGAEVETLGIEQHDQVLAATSHLPHVLAYSLVNTLTETEFVDEIFRFAAGGFRDFSRIASSDPVMWRDICLENRDAILEALEHFQTNLDRLKQSIEDSNGPELFEAFHHAKTIRDSKVAGD